MIALIAALILSQNTPRHPSPATADNVSVGNGTNWVSRSLPTGASASQVLRYDSTGPSFNAVTLQKSLWSVFCPSGVSCNDNATPFMSVMKSAPENYSLSDVSCNAGTAGTGGGNITFTVYNATNSVILTSCTMACTAVGPTGSSCTLSGGLSAGKEYRVYTTGCTTQPVNMWCNLPLGY